MTTNAGHAALGLAVGALLLSACGGSTTGAPAVAADSAVPNGGACVILPDSASSARWETADRKYLADAFTAAGIPYDIQNAHGDKARFATIAEGMIAGGCAVMAIVNLDNDSGAAVIKKATAAGIPVIDYDRLTVGGGAKYYVSFDSLAVGHAIGDGLVTCLRASGVKTGPVALLDGAPTDSNAGLYAQGYRTALTDAGYSIADEQAVPEWDNTKAGTIFEQMYTKAGGNFVGVAAANDGLGGAVIAVLDRNGHTGKVPVTGQDATDEGLQRVLLGTQCLTVYTAVAKEANAAAQLMIALIKDDTAKADALTNGTVTDTVTNAQVPSVLFAPQQIFANDVKDVVADGYTTADRVCTTVALRAACKQFGVQ